MTILERAFYFARDKHAGQYRRDGVTPYFNHCIAVADLCHGDYIRAIAFCHDLLEDGRTTFGEMIDNVGVPVTIACQDLTHSPEETYNEYIYRIKTLGSPEAMIVKIADIVSNLSDSPTERQRVKYFNALLILCNPEPQAEQFK